MTRVALTPASDLFAQSLISGKAWACGSVKAIDEGGIEMVMSRLSLGFASRRVAGRIRCIGIEGACQSQTCAPHSVVPSIRSVARRAAHVARRGARRNLSNVHDEPSVGRWVVLRRCWRERALELRRRVAIGRLAFGDACTRAKELVMTTSRYWPWQGLLGALLAVGSIGAASGTAPVVGSASTALSVQPSVLLSVDQNRETVVDRVVAEWGDALVNSGALFSKDQLRRLLIGLRADHLLAASLAGSLNGLRMIIAHALAADDPAAMTRVNTKALGDLAEDLVYTPVAPCRIVDTRNAGGAFGPGEGRAYRAYLTSGTFASQGGAATNCAIPANPAAAALNITVVSNTGSGFLTAWPYNGSFPNASTLNYVAGQTVANGALIPLCQSSCAAEFNVLLSGGGNLIVDIVGYFRAPEATILDCATAGSSVNIPAGGAAQVTALATCAAGYELTGGGCSFGDANGNTTTSSAVLLNRTTRFFDGSAYTNQWLCGWTNTDQVNAYKGFARAVCCRVPGR